MEYRTDLPPDKNSFHSFSIADIALDRNQVGVLVFVRLQIDADNVMTVRQQSPLEDAAEKPSATSD